MNWKTRRVKLLVLCGLLLIGIARYGNADTFDDEGPVEWQWECVSSGYYGTDVFPNGTYKPTTEKDVRSIFINLRKAGEVTRSWCGFSESWSTYIAQVSGTSKLANFYSANKNSSCPGKVEITFNDGKTIERIIGSRDGKTLIVMRDDNDWRFTIGSIGLTTERYGRKLRIVAPQPQYNYPAEASMWMLTGECRMTKDGTAKKDVQ